MSKITAESIASLQERKYFERATSMWEPVISHLAKRIHEQPGGVFAALDQQKSSSEIEDFLSEQAITFLTKVARSV